MSIAALLQAAEYLERRERGKFLIFFSLSSIFFLSFYLNEPFQESWLRCGGHEVDIYI